MAVRRKVVNPGYNPSNYQHDIALLQLSRPIRFRRHVIPVCLPHYGEEFAGQKATVTGWGRTRYGKYQTSCFLEINSERNLHCSEV